MAKTRGMYIGGACWGVIALVGSSTPPLRQLQALLDLETGHGAHIQASVPHVPPAPPPKLRCAFKYYLNKLMYICMRCFLRKVCASLRMSRRKQHAPNTKDKIIIKSLLFSWREGRALKVFYLAFRQGAFTAARRRLKISSELCTESSPLHWQIQLNREPSQPGPRGGKNNLHSKDDSSHLVFLMPSVKGGLSSCCKVTLRRLEDRLGLVRSALPALHFVPRRGSLS